MQDMNKTELLALSWFLWGVSYYLYYPLISIYAIQFITTNELPTLYISYSVLGMLMPLIGYKISKRIGIVKSIILGMALGGMGLILMGLAVNMETLFISYSLSSTVFISLPNYYSYMSNLGKGVISKVWAFSILPSLFSPFVGGEVATIFSLRYVFIIAGLFNILASLPITRLEDIKVMDDNGSLISRKVLIPYVVIIPISLSFPYVFLEVKDVYNLDYTEIGLLATIAEILGAVLTLLSSYKKGFLPLFLFLFSLTYLLYLNPLFAIFFGNWEAIIPTSLEDSNAKSTRDFAVINSLQQSAWLVGYLISLSLSSPKLSLLSSSIISLFLALSLKYFRRV
ncbi:hypothetical protein WIW90_00975 [Sulfolobaceae archaeon RB850M]